MNGLNLYLSLARSLEVLLQVAQQEQDGSDQPIIIKKSLGWSISTQFYSLIRTNSDYAIKYLSYVVFVERI